MSEEKTTPKNDKGNEPKPNDIEPTELSSPQIEKLLPPGIIEKLSPEDKETIEVSLSNFSMSSGMFRPVNPIAEKIEPDHITTIIKNADEDSNREYSDRKSVRRYTVAYLSIGLVAFGLLTYFLVNKDANIYFDAIKIIAAVLGGFGGGFGLGYYKSKKENK